MKPTIEQVDAAISQIEDFIQDEQNLELDNTALFALRFLRLAMDEPDTETQILGLQGLTQQRITESPLEGVSRSFKAMRDILLKKADTDQ